MTINEFAKIITEKEGLKVSISIAQVKEVLCLVNWELEGELYKAIRRV